MSKIVLIRGLPGSGKTTLAKANYPEHEHFEADMYHIDDEGNYNFDFSKIKEAHAWCQDSTSLALGHGLDVVVSNTFTQLWEMQPYLKMGCPVEIIVATGNFENIHNVPTDIIEKMRDRWEDVEL